MVKTKIIETTEKYDENGKLVEKIVREETKEDVSTPNVLNTPNENIWCNDNWWEKPTVMY